MKKLFNRLIILIKDDIDKFEEHEMKKIRPIMKKRFDRLISKNEMRRKPKISRDKLNNKMINHIWRLVDTEKKKK